MASPTRDPARFAARLGDAQRLLWIEFGGLGDHLHSLPALWTLRQNCPRAHISLLVGAGGAGLFQALAPWIDQVWGYARTGLAADVRWLRLLRAQGFDAGLQLMQSNRGAAFLALSGARSKLARRNDEHKPWWWQPWAIGHVAVQPYHQFPMYLQRWRCLRDAGLAGAEPESLALGAHAQIDPGLRRARGIAADEDRAYLHLSASATDDLRDLPARQMIELWEALHAALPALRFVVSSNDSQRGRDKLQHLLEGLSFPLWKVFAGNLDVPAFAAVVQGAALHVGPDSGGLHLARLAGTPSVSWFRPNAHIKNWFPTEPGHRAFIAPESRGDGLHGLATATLVEAAQELIAGAKRSSQVGP